jgi:molybdate transport system substrate-binding protein
MIASMLRRVLIGCLLALAMTAIRPAAAQNDSVTIFAAASLKNVLDAINAKWHEETGKPAAVISYAASPTLAKQIDNGAPADIFISADLQWMDYLQQRNLIQSKTRVDLLGNRLVLVAPLNSALGRTVRVTLGAGFPLAKLLRGGRLAMADPEAVPAGIYGKAALTNLGAWSSVAGRVAAAENVRAALALVARGEAPLGIVYQTDAAVEPGVRVVATFPPGSTPPIVYPMALTKGARPGAAAFASYLRGPAARAQFEAQGFIVLDRAQ